MLMHPNRSQNFDGRRGHLRRAAISARRALLASALAVAASALATPIAGGALQAAGPINTAPPTFSGTPQDGMVLAQSNHGQWTSSSRLTFTHQWQRCNSAGANCTAITGATNRNYRLRSADVGHQVTLVVTATDKESQAASAAATPVGPVTAPAPPSNSALPTISGTPLDGVLLARSSNGQWTSPDPLSFTYQWQQCDSAGANCTAINGATNRNYRLTSADVGHQVTLVVTATDKESQAASAAATPVGPVIDATPITECGTNITAPGGYRLDADLVCSFQDGIDINASDVRLSLNGHSISTNYAAVALGLSTPVDRVDVSGPGNITGSENAGLVVGDASDSTVTGVTASGNRLGIAAIGPQTAVHNTVSGNTLTGNEIAVQILGNADSTYKNNNCSNNSTAGIQIGGSAEFDQFTSGNTVSGNTCNNNDLYGIQAYADGGATGNTISGNTATDNGAWDAVDDNPDCGTNTWTANTFVNAAPSCVQ